MAGSVTGVGVPPAPFHQFIQHVSEDLGPLSITFSSTYLTVASLVVTQIDFLSPPESAEPVKIVSIDTFVSQTYTVSSANTGKVLKAPPNRHLMRKVDPNRPNSKTGRDGPQERLEGDVPISDPRPLRSLDPQKEWTYKSFSRIPTEEVVRPSTLPGAKTPIRVDHHMVCEIKYLLASGEEKNLALGRPIMIRSCFNLIDDLRVPRYEEAPSEEPTLLRIGRNKCLCKSKLAETFDRAAYEFGRQSLADNKTLGVDEGAEESPSTGSEGFRKWDEAEVAKRRLGKSPAVPSEMRTVPREPDHFLG